MKKKILFVEDDAQYQRLIANVLIKQGYDIVLCDNAADAIDIYQEEHFDLLLTDLMMKSIDGIQLLSYIRNYDDEIKIILLTATEEDSYEVKALSLLADDYIRKPVMIDVLLARIARALKETKKIKSSILFSEPEKIKLDLVSRKVYKDEKLVHLTMREFSVLSYFLRNKNIPITRERLLEEVWKVEEGSIDMRNVDALVKKLRSKLYLSCVYSIRGIGYEWSEE